MIKVNAVSKVYRITRKKTWFSRVKQQVHAVSDLSFAFGRGDIIGLLGLNGAGKTTTIKMMATLLEPTEGSITIDGLDVVQDRRKVQAKINMIAGGERMLYFRLTARENLAYFGRLYGLTEAEIVMRSDQLLEEVGLLEAADTPVEQYSKGMKQRLQIARGLINDPDYILLDEPTIGLDAPIARQLRKTVKRLAVEQGKGILLTSHYLQEVEELCDRVYVIDKGKLIFADTPQEVVRQAAGYQVLHIRMAGWEEKHYHSVLQTFALPPNAMRMTTHPDEEGSTVTLSINTESADALMPNMLPWLVERGLRVQHLQTNKPTLEDAIVLLSGGEGPRERILASVSS